MMDENYKDMLGANTETEVLEFKEAKRGFAVDDLGKYFSALSNEANLYQTSEALLFFGVEDKIKPGNSERCVVGTIIDDKKINEWKHEIHNNISPKMSFTDVVIQICIGNNFCAPVILCLFSDSFNFFNTHCHETFPFSRIEMTFP